MFLTLRPTSSITSRSTVCSSVSPISVKPATSASKATPLFLAYRVIRSLSLLVTPTITAGLILGYEIFSNNIGGGLCLYHNGPIVINRNSIIGSNCSLHGDNCIGNDGISDDCPVIGDNVEIGVGAKIIGNVRIANNVTVGAGAVVVSDILKENSVVVGVPAKIIKIKQ